MPEKLSPKSKDGKMMRIKSSSGSKNISPAVLNDEKIKRRFGEEGKKLAKHEFDWDKIVGRFEGIYRNVWWGE